MTSDSTSSVSVDSPDVTHREAPSLPPHVFERPRLVELLAAGTQGRVTTVVAPAGYGKSVAVAQWRERASDRPVAWIDLRAIDDDGVRFARALELELVAALGDAAPRLDLVDSGGHSLGVDLVEVLVDDLTLVPDVVVVLDNFEAITGPALLADVAALIDRAPPSLHVVVISRSDPAIGTSRLRLRGELIEIRRESLAMDADEAALLLSQTARVELAPATLDLLVERTSGWPAALQLAALSLRTADDPAAFVERFSGDDQFVAEYLTDEVLRACSPVERRFLTETSVLRRINGALGDAVLASTGTRAMLRALERSGMLLVRDEGPGDWYHYHPLLHELLRTELEVGDPPRHRELLLRAAAWHRDVDDDLEAASAYLVAARAWDELLAMSQVHGRACFERGMTTMLRSRIDAIPEQVRATSTLAVLTSAALHVLCGQTRVAEDELGQLEHDRTLTTWERAISATTRAAMVAWHLEPRQALDAGRRALQLVADIGPDDDPVDVLGITSLPSLEAIALVAMGRAAHYLGRDEEARELLVRATEQSQGSYLPWYLHSLGVRSTLEAMSGDLRTATDLAARVVAVASESGLASHPATGEAQLALAIVRREQDSLAEASYALDAAIGLVRSNHRWPLMRLHAAELASLGVASGDRSAVSRLFDDGTPDASGERRPYAGRLLAVAMRGLVAAGDPQGAAALADARADLRGSEEVHLAELAVAVTCDDRERARRLVEELEGSTRLRTAVECRLWHAVLDDRAGARDRAFERCSEAVELASEQGLRRVFLDAGPEVLALVRAHHEHAPTAFVRSILDRDLGRDLDGRPASPRVAGLVEQLTDREMAVLHYLPTRLSNAEIAARLYVSINTVKTHLKHVYRKLDVDSRDGAIDRAVSLGLLR